MSAGVSGVSLASLSTESRRATVFDSVADRFIVSFNSSTAQAELTHVNNKSSALLAGMLPLRKGGGSAPVHLLGRKQARKFSSQFSALPYTIAFPLGRR